MATLSNLSTRILTAAVGVPILSFCLYSLPTWCFFCVTVTVSALGAWEWLGMTHAADRPVQWIGMLFTVVVSGAVYCAAQEPRFLITGFLGLLFLGPMVTLFRLHEISPAALRIHAMIVAPCAVGIPLTLLALIRRDHGAGYVVLALLLAWLGDTFGYFVGRWFGGPKLAPRISPQKTRAGALGSLGGSLLAGFLVHTLFLPTLPLLHALALGGMGGLCGQLGDLSESLLKRSLQAKDSGSILPGHGGILDRVDALLATSPLVFVYLLWQ